MDVFQKREIPVKILLAVLMDSCAVMRGCKTGLEKRLRDGPVPHLLDIDGDLCHHIHNIVKKFSNNFDNYLEKLFRDLYRNFDLSPDLLKRLDLLVSVTFRNPPNYEATRWLSVLDGCIDFPYMRDVYVVFYSSYVDNKRSQIKRKLESIFEKYNISKASQESIEEMVKALRKKTFKSDGKVRIMGTADAVLFSESKVTLLTSTTSFQEYAVSCCFKGASS